MWQKAKVINCDLPAYIGREIWVEAQRPKAVACIDIKGVKSVSEQLFSNIIDERGISYVFGSRHLELLPIFEETADQEVLVIPNFPS